jgi:hypothetical protein
MAQRNSFGAAESRQRSNLVQAEDIDFIGRTRHGAAPESDQVWKSRVCSNGDSPMMSCSHRCQHDLRVPCVKAASNIGTGDIIQDMGVIAESPHAEAFPYVAVEVN